MPEFSTSADIAARLVNGEVVKAFEQDGAIVLRGAFSEGWVGAIRQTLGRRLAKANASPKFSILRDLFFSEPEIREFVFQSPAADIAARITRSASVRFYFDQSFVKQPGTSEVTPWHNDLPYWPVSGDQICSIWFALDRITRQTSGLEYVRGSHKWRRHFRPVGFTQAGKQFFAGATGEDLPDFDSNRSEFDFLSWDLEPGDCVIHHALTVHGGRGNSSREHWRRALATRWLGDDVRYRSPEPFSDRLLIDDASVAGQFIASERFPLVRKRQVLGPVTADH